MLFGGILPEPAGLEIGACLSGLLGQRLCYRSVPTRAVCAEIPRARGFRSSWVGGVSIACLPSIKS